MKKLLTMSLVLLWSASACCATDGLDGIANEDGVVLPALPVPFLPTTSATGNAAAALVNLPNLPEPVVLSTVQASPSGGLQFKSNLNGDLVLIRQDFSGEKSAPLAVDYVSNKIPATTVGWLVSNQPDRTETIMNMGWRIGGNQQILLSTADLRGTVEGDAESRAPYANQVSGGLNYRYYVNQPWLTGVELTGYTSGSQSLNGDGQQRFAGGSLVGMQMGLEAAPLRNARLKIGVGSERVSYDALSGIEPVQNLSTSIKWSQIIDPTIRYSAAVEGRGGDRSVSTGFDVNLRNGQQLGFKVARVQSAETQTVDNALQLSYTLQFGKKFIPFQPKADNAPWNASLTPEVLQRPGYLPKSVLTRSDTGTF